MDKSIFSISNKTFPSSVAYSTHITELYQCTVANAGIPPSFLSSLHLLLFPLTLLLPTQPLCELPSPFICM